MLIDGLHGSLVTGDIIFVWAILEECLKVGDIRSSVVAFKFCR